MEAPPWDPLRNDSLPPTLTPAVPPYVKLGLTVVYTVFYSLLFLFIYAQLWLVLRYRHKRLSYQSVFLFLCLFWASLRTVLFSFYFKDFVAANALSPFVFWLLYCFPVCLQFFTLTLMNLYFTQVSRGRPPPLAGTPGGAHLAGPMAAAGAGRRALGLRVRACVESIDPGVVRALSHLQAFVPGNAVSFPKGEKGKGKESEGWRPPVILCPQVGITQRAAASPCTHQTRY